MVEEYKHSEVVLAKKAEGKKMMEIMNVVIEEGERKKREKKRWDKERGKEEKNGGVSLVESIFRPGSEANKGETEVVAVDCEMVEIDRNSDGLARVSIVNYNGQVLYDEYVRPEGRITNFRTWVSGISPHHMHQAKPFSEAKSEVHALLKDKIIVGHSLSGDFRVLHLEEGVTVSRDKIRDTSKYKKYQSQHGQAQSLKVLTEKFLQRRIQSGSHCSVTDARAALALYRISEQEWENYAKQKNYSNL